MDIESVKEKPKRRVSRKKKEPIEKPTVNYGHGAGKLMRMRKAGYTMADIRAMK